MEEQGTCINFIASTFANGFVNIAVDMVMVIMPIYEVLKLNLSVQKKIGVAVMFAAGLVYVFSSSNPCVKPVLMLMRRLTAVGIVRVVILALNLPDINPTCVYPPSLPSRCMKLANKKQQTNWNPLSTGLQLNAKSPSSVSAFPQAAPSLPMSFLAQTQPIAPQLPTDTKLQQELQVGLLLCLLFPGQGQVRRRRVRFQRQCHTQLILAQRLSS